MARLEQARTQFLLRIDRIDDFVHRSVGAKHPSAARPAFLAHQIEWTYETALLKLVIASELYFEISLGLYAIGEKCASGYRPKRLRKVPLTLPAMLAVFRGDQEFVGWNDPSNVIKRAEKWLKYGEPFQTSLSSASRMLSYMRTMRNAVAHASDSAVEKYRSATLKLYGASPRQTSPGVQLTDPPPTSIPYLAGATLFDAAMATYRQLASRIVP